jgi:acyl-[acyl carrier protein]--UDP-N-acetylglucosamine O-acyltransferase
MLTPNGLFDLTDFEYRRLFDNCEYVWNALSKISGYIQSMLTPNITKIRISGDVLSRTYVLYNGEVLDNGFELLPGDIANGRFRVFSDGQELIGATVLYAGACLFDNQISIGQGSVIEPGALIKGPTIIGKNTEVRQGAYIRGTCIVGDRCVVGHTTEIKSSVMLNGAKAGHFAYIGDSILGNNVNLGAGTKLANLKLTNSNIIIKINNMIHNTGIRKFGAIMGDGVETGCNSVTNPGTILGKTSMVYPCVSVKGGYYPSGSRITLNSMKHKD